MAHRAHNRRRTSSRRDATPRSNLYGRIWRQVARIPRGRVATYGQIASLAGLGRNARQVGYALHALPEGVAVPWQRVVNAAGRISLPHEDGRYDLQRALLESEGVVFARGRIDLARFGWRPRLRS